MASTPPQTETQTPKDKDVPFDPSKPPSLWSTFTSLRLDDLVQSHRLPCLKNALLTGWIAGIGIGFVRYVATPKLSRSLSKSVNWGLGSFGLTAALSWEYCRYQRRLMQIQLDNMAFEVNQKRQNASSPSEPSK